MSAETGDGALTVSTDGLTNLHWAGMALAVVTGVVHLGLAASLGASGLGIAFVVAGVGFFGGVAAMLVDYQRDLVVLLGIPFTLGQIVAWYALNAGDLSTLGIGDKVVQVLLVVILVVIYRQE